MHQIKMLSTDLAASELDMCATISSFFFPCSNLVMRDTLKMIKIMSASLILPVA